MVAKDYRSCDFASDLSILPKLTDGQCFKYLVWERKWSAERLASIETEDGMLLFKSGHVTNVETCKLDCGRYYIKATCQRQTAQSLSPYTVWILVSSSGTYEKAGCACIG